MITDDPAYKAHLWRLAHDIDWLSDEGATALLSAAFEIANGRFPTWIVDRLVQIANATLKMQRFAEHRPVASMLSRRRVIGNTPRSGIGA